MKIRKLDARGVAHHFLLAVIVVGLALFGVYRLVASHADTCTGMSDPVSGTCSPTSSPLAYNCVVSGVPADTGYGQTFSPTVTVYNNGSTSIAPTLTESQSAGTMQLKSGESYTFPSIAPGASASHTFGSYQTPYGNAYQNQQGEVTFTAASPSFACSGTFNYPTQASIASEGCTLNGVPSTVTQGQTFTPTVTIHNSGNVVLVPWVITSASGQTNVKYNLSKTLSNTQVLANSSYTYTLPQFKAADYFSTTYTINVRVPNNNPNNPAGNSPTATCSKSFTMTISPISSLTINPGDFTGLVRTAIVTDYPKGNVLKYSAGSSTASIPYAKAVGTSVKKFVGADLGRSVKMCATGKTPYHNGNVELTLTPAFKATVTEFNWNFGGTYSTKCTTFNIVSRSQALQDIAYTELSKAVLDTSLSNAAPYSTAYLDNVTFTLQ